MATRRPYGTGSLIHREGETYRFQIRADGKMLSRVFTARNITEANKAAGAIRIELLEEHERLKDASGVEREVRQAWTVERYIEHYLTAWAPFHLADTTRARYASIFRNNVIPYIGKKRIAEVTPSDLTALYAKLGTPGARTRGEGALSGLTISTVHNVLRALFTFAVESERDLSENPAASKAARPKVDRTPKRPQALSLADVEALVSLAAESAPEIAVPVMLSAYLGTRRGETVGLRWEDVDWDAQTITVRRSVSHTQADGRNVKGTKTGKDRTIPLDSHTLSELKRIQREQREARMRFGRGWRGAAKPSEDFIATTPDGAGMNPMTFSARFRTLCKREGHESWTLHGLRHAWVSQMISLGFDAVTIAAMSGHSSQVLLDTYAHAFDARKREAMDTLGKARMEVRAAQ